MALHSQRQYHSEGPQALSFQEMRAFLLLEGRGFPVSYYPSLSRMLRALDTEYFNLLAKRRRSKAN